MQNQLPILIHIDAKPSFYNNDPRSFKQTPLKTRLTSKKLLFRP